MNCATENNPPITINNLGENMEKYKVGVIGAGKMGLLHGGIFNSLEHSKLSGVADNDKFVVNILKNYLPSVTICNNHNEMLEKVNPDVVVITTPVFLHKKMIEDSMDCGAAIFVEKPLVAKKSECKSLLSNNYKHQTLVGYCRRFMQTYNLAKDIINNESLGHVNFINSQLYVSQVFNPCKGWLYDPNLSGGGVLVDLGSHAIDLLHYLVGDLQLVSGFAKPIFNKDVEDCVSINLLFKNGAFGSLQISWSVRNYRLPELKIMIHLDNGSIIVTEKYITVYSESNFGDLRKGWNNFYKQELTKDIYVNIAGAEYTEEDSHLIDCIIQNKPTRCDFREAAKTNIVMDHIYSSISKGETESIKYEG